MNRYGFALWPGSLLFALLLSGCEPDGKPAAERSATALRTPASTYSRPNERYYLDTAYVKALYQGRNNFRAFAQMEEYQEFELQHDSVVALLRTLYGSEPGFTQNLARLEKNREKFLVNTRQSVSDDYRKFT